MSDENQTQPPAEPTPAPTVAELQALLAERDAALEKISGKYSAAQADITKFRKRADEIDAAQAAAEAERLKNAPLEERNAALQKELEEMRLKAEAAAQTAKEAEAAQTEFMLSHDLLEAGVRPDALKAALKSVTEEFFSEDKTGDLIFDAEAFFKQYPFFKAEATPNTPSTVRIGSTRSVTNAGGGSFTRAQIGEMSSEEFAKNKAAILAAQARGEIR